MTTNLISRAEREVPFFLKNHITCFLKQDEQETLSTVSRHFYFNHLARFDLASKTELIPGVARCIKGLAISECACLEQMSRLSGKTDWRKIFENIVLTSVQKYFSDKNAIRFCFIGAGGGLQPLTMLQQIPKIKKTAQTLLLADPIYDPDPNQFINDLTKMVHFISPTTKVQTTGSIEDIVESDSINTVDVFILFDSDLFREITDSESESEDTSLLANNYLFEVNRLLNAIRSTGRTKMFISGEWAKVSTGKELERQLVTRVVFQDQHAKKYDYHYFDDQILPHKTLFLGHASDPIAMPLLKAPSSEEDWKQTRLEIAGKFRSSEPQQKFLESIRETGYVLEQTFPDESDNREI